MTFKSLFTFRKAAAQGGQTDDVGIIVMLMMALVFVPVIAAHAASMLQDGSGTQQIAGLFSVLLKVF